MPSFSQLRSEKARGKVSTKQEISKKKAVMASKLALKKKESGSKVVYRMVSKMGVEFKPKLPRLKRLNTTPVYCPPMEQLVSPRLEQLVEQDLVWVMHNISRVKLPLENMQAIPVWVKSSFGDGSVFKWYENWHAKGTLLYKLEEMNRSVDVNLQYFGLRFVEVCPITYSALVYCPMCKKTFKFSRENVDGMGCCKWLYCAHCLKDRMVATSMDGAVDPMCFCGYKKPCIFDTCQLENSIVDMFAETRVLKPKEEGNYFSKDWDHVTSLNYGGCKKCIEDRELCSECVAELRKNVPPMNKM